LWSSGSIRLDFDDEVRVERMGDLVSCEKDLGHREELAEGFVVAFDGYGSGCEHEKR